MGCLDLVLIIEKNWVSRRHYHRHLFFFLWHTAGMYTVLATSIQILAAYIQIRHISSIQHLLTTPATQTLVCSLVLSRLDYCNSSLSGCPQYLLDKLQNVQNAAARLVCKAKKSDHIHPILETVCTGYQ